MIFLLPLPPHDTLFPLYLILISVDYLVCSEITVLLGFSSVRNFKNDNIPVILKV